jgi:hypothetical protein
MAGGAPEIYLDIPASYEIFIERVDRFTAGASPL